MVDSQCRPRRHWESTIPMGGTPRTYSQRNLLVKGRVSRSRASGTPPEGTSLTGRPPLAPARPERTVPPKPGVWVPNSWRAFGEPGLASLWRAFGEPLASLWRACLTGEPWRAFGEGEGGVRRAFGEPGLASLWRALANLWRALASLWRAFGEPLASLGSPASLGLTGLSEQHSCARLHAQIHLSVADARREGRTDSPECDGRREGRTDSPEYDGRTEGGNAQIHLSVTHGGTDAQIHRSVTDGRRDAQIHLSVTDARRHGRTDSPECDGRREGRTDSPECDGERSNPAQRSSLTQALTSLSPASLGLTGRGSPASLGEPKAHGEPF
eukprot:gene12221-biopygen13304